MAGPTETEEHPLSYHRKWALMSQRDLARVAGCTASTVYLIEAGRTMPQLQMMRKICDALGLDWQDVTEFRVAMHQHGLVPLE
jgi:DNA-binding XRE family transcriptional regulator